MKTIEFKSNYGNFAYRMTAQIGDEVNAASEALCLEGLANICYRVAGSAVDKALGVKKGEGRKAVLFVPNMGDEIDAAVNKKLAELEAKQTVLVELKLNFMVTGQHMFGEGGDAPTKEATEMWTRVQALEEAKFNKAMVALGFEDNVEIDSEGKPTVHTFDYDDEKGILACKRKLQEAKAAAKAQAASLLGL